MPNEQVVSAENELVNRVSSELNDVAPGFDPAIITTMMDMLMDMLSNCGNTNDVTPAQAVNRVKNLSGFEKAALKSRLKKRARRDGVKQADDLAPLAVNAVAKVAKSATEQECLDFAAVLLPIANTDFTMI